MLSSVINNPVRGSLLESIFRFEEPSPAYFFTLQSSCEVLSSEHVPSLSIPLLFKSQILVNCLQELFKNCNYNYKIQSDMEEEIQSVTSSEWHSVHRRLDDLENIVTDLKLKLETFGECKCNRRNSNLETQHSDDEVESLIGINPQSTLTTAVSGILSSFGQSTLQLEETLTLAGGNAKNSADSTSISRTHSSLSDSTSLNTKSTLRLSNGIGIQDIEKYRRVGVKLRRFDQAEVTGTSSTSEFRIVNNTSTLTSTNKESHISSMRRPVLRRKRNGVRAEHTSAPPSSHKKRFVCNFCSKRFGVKSKLTVHTRVHTGDKPFQCNICSKAFTQNSILKSHTRIHTGDKPFACGFCSKKFKRTQHLASHLRTHTGERPYACQLCSKTFATPCTLHRHLRVHTREKPYSCPFCPKIFAHSNSLKLHLKKHPG